MTTLPNDIATLKALVKERLEKNKRLEAEHAELRRGLGLECCGRQFASRVRNCSKSASIRLAAVKIGSH